ncbi:hypothetical protein GCM10027048_09420 [Hymenobacter coalescens]
MEDYAAKMAGKTDADLLRYVEHRAEYIDDAVLAALTELERRGHAVPDAAALRTELEAAARRQAAAAPVAPVPPPWARAQATEEVEEVPAGPELYTPTTVAIYSVFSFLIGGILMLLNLLRLRRYGGAALLLALVILVVWAGSWTADYFKLLPQYVLLGINFVLALLYVYVLWPYFIGRQHYRPRNWLSPLLVVLVIQLLFALLYYAGWAPPGTGQ